MNGVAVRANSRSRIRGPNGDASSSFAPVSPRAIERIIERTLHSPLPFLLLIAALAVPLAACGADLEPGGNTSADAANRSPIEPDVSRAGNRSSEADTIDRENKQDGPGNMDRLDDAEIRSLLLNRNVTALSSGMPIPQSERFLANGVVLVQLDRVAVQRRYQIRNSELCVAATADQLQCRRLFRGPGGSIYQSFVGRANELILIQVH